MSAIGKKGEVSSYQIVVLVLAVIGFVIILAVIYGIYENKYSDKEICHLSVWGRATSPGIASGYIPLKCSASKVCITDPSEKEWGECESRFGPDSGAQVIKLSGDARAKAQKIEEISANAMYDCWDMMGRGKLSLFTTNMNAIGYSPVESSCVVCSRVAVDESVRAEDMKDKNGEVTKQGVLDKVDINKYLQENLVPGSSLTYSQAFGTSSRTFAKAEDGLFSDVKVEDKATGSLESNKDHREIAFVFMQIDTIKEFEAIKNQLGVAGTAAAFTFSTPIVRGTAWSVVTAGAKNPYAWLALVIAGVGSMGYGEYTAAQGREMAAGPGYCGSFTSQVDAKQGCSVVKALDWDASSINYLCKNIEGVV